MSIKYKTPEDVPNKVICQRLNELSKAVTKGKAAIAREFVMRIPAELDYDADLVLSIAAIRLRDLESAKVGYQKYQFCKAVDCSWIRHSPSCVLKPFKCTYTAKEFHKWLYDNGFEIVRRQYENRIVPTNIID